MKPARYIATPEDHAKALAWVMSTEDRDNWGERWICATGIRLGTLKSRLHRDRRMLMETLGDRA